MRTFRKVGTNSGNNGCPTLYADPASDTYAVQGDPVTDPDELGQLDLAAGEGVVTVPRELLANFGPKEPVRVPRWISFTEFDSMFTGLKHSAWRLETRRRYASDEATSTYAQFLAKGNVDWDLNDSWCEERRQQRDLGKRFERVRILDTPPTEGQRYLLDNGRRNMAAGEDIRTLTRGKADHLQLPAEDFWLFDSRVVAVLHFDAADEMTGVELITNPVEILRYAQVREAAWHLAIPFNTTG
jgi:hypothetical protein